MKIILKTVSSVRLASVELDRAQPVAQTGKGVASWIVMK
jgi:hypothetical protein